MIATVIFTVFLKLEHIDYIIAIMMVMMMMMMLRFSISRRIQTNDES